MRLHRAQLDGDGRKSWGIGCLVSLAARLMAVPTTPVESSSIDCNGKQQQQRIKKKSRKKSGTSSNSKLRSVARQEFSKAIVGSAGAVSDPEHLPSLHVAYMEFLKMFPRFVDTLGVDEVREEEYAHLRGRVCLDYSGFGLFSHLQRVCDASASSFRLAYVSANLPTHALYGVADRDSFEGYIRRRIMDYFRISDSDYCMVFTASKGSAVKLLAESYRFDTHGRLLTAYDHRSQSIEWMIECAKEKGAKVSTGMFRWPSLRICFKDLQKQLVDKKLKKDSIKGLFVFPLQSRVTGARYSYQWIPLAQQNQWHVLLDASALGPRDMDALGLSLFRPDFIVSSFYKVFGEDPSGFGCLFIKKSAISSLYNSSKARAVGMVKLLPCSLQVDNQEHEVHDFRGLEHEVDPSNFSSFSGPLSAEEVRDKSTEGFGATVIATLDRCMSEEASYEEKTEFDDNTVRDCAEGSEGEATGISRITLLYPSEDAAATKINHKLKGKMLEETDAGGASKNNSDSAAGPSNSKIHTLQELLALPDDDLKHQWNTEGERYEEGVVCKALDQTKMLGLSKIRNRLRYLINWLVVSLGNLRHPTASDTGLTPPLVQIYGPGKKYDRGASIAFNLYDWNGLLFQPELVQRLADRNKISLGLAEIKNLHFIDHVPDLQNIAFPKSNSCSISGGAEGLKHSFVAVTLALSYMSSFEDVYRVWAFIAKFLDADFVNKEAWRYHSLNQEIVILGS